MENKVSVNIRPTAEKNNKYDVYVQDFTTYDIIENHDCLDKQEAFDLWNALGDKYDNRCMCQFK